MTALQSQKMPKRGTKVQMGRMKCVTRPQIFITRPHHGPIHLQKNLDRLGYAHPFKIDQEQVFLHT
jgi:hypothetical protein